MRRLVLLALTVAALATASAACEPKTRVLEGQTAISVDLDAPVNGAWTQVSSVCAGAFSFLVSLDVDGDRDFEWRFAFDPDERTLWGCPGGECPDSTIDAHLGTPRRILVEGITRAPGDYANGAHDVVCRGMADLESEMGSIAIADSGALQVIQTHVPMLRIGDLNGVYTTTGFFFAISESGMDPEASIDSPSPKGGSLYLAGGLNRTGNVEQDGVFAFEPWRIGVRRVATLSVPRWSIAMAPFRELTGPALLLAGGHKDFTGVENSGTTIGEILRPDGSFSVMTDTMSATRTSMYAHRIERDGGTEIVALVGGCHFQNGTIPLNDYEYFSPDGSACGETGPAFCKPNAITWSPAGGGCGMVSARARNALGQPLVLVAGGGAGENGMGVWALDVSGDGVFSALPDLGEGLANAATLEVNENLTYVIGGGRGTGPDTYAMRTTMGAFVDGAWSANVGPGLRTPRWNHALVPLADGRVLIAGGDRDASGESLYNKAPLKSLEMYTPGAPFTDGTFELLARPGQTCVTGSNGGCVVMRYRRSGPFAGRLTGTSTWLNGAVVIGGSAYDDTLYNHHVAADPPELFVPAYGCAAGTSVAADVVDGTPVAGLEHCDLGRDPARLPLTDPSDP